MIMNGRSLSTTRRGALRGLAAAGIIGLAGCTNERSDTSSSTPSDQTSDEPQAWSERELSGKPAHHDDPNWRMMGHDTGLTFHNPHADGPSDNPSVRWTFEGRGDTLDRHNYYHPLIVDGTVYVTVAPKDETGGLAAIDAETGESEMLIESTKNLWKPTIFDGTVYALLGNSVGAFDLSDGTQLWETDGLLGRMSEPIYVDGVVVTGRGSAILGIDAATGEELWHIGEPQVQAVAYHPVIADGMVVQSDRRSVHDLRTGEQRAELPHLIAHQSINDGLVIGWEFTEENLGTGNTFAVDWNSLETAWTKPENERSISKMTSSAGDTYLSLEEMEADSTTFLVARSLTTGERLWQTRLEESVPAYIATDGTRAYCADSMYYDLALDLEDGSIQWEYSPDGDAVGGGVALADDLLVISDGVGNLWALE